MNYKFIKTTAFVFSTFFAAAACAVGLVPTNSAESTQPDVVVVPHDLQADKVPEFVAPLDERQVRSLLIGQLSDKAEEYARKEANQPESIITLLKGINNPDTALGGGVYEVINSAPDFFNEIKRVLRILSDKTGVVGFLKMLLVLWLTILAAWLIEKACLYRWRKSKQDNNDFDENTLLRTKVGYPFLVFAVNFIGLILFAVAGYVIASFIYDEQSTRYVVMMRLFDAIVLVRFFALVFKLVLSPPPNGLSLIEKAINQSMLYNSLVAFAFIYIVGVEINTMLFEYGLSNAHFVLSMMILFGLIVNPIVVFFVWTQRIDIDRILFGQVDSQTSQNGNYVYAARAMVWPSIVTFVIYLAFVNWQIQALIKNDKGRETIEITWWITLLFPLIDLLVTSLLNKLVSLGPFQHARFQQRKQRFIFVIRSVVRLFLIAILIITLMDAWGFNLLAKFNTESGKNLLHTLTDIGVTIILAYLIWEAVRLWMERNMPDEDSEEDGMEEGGMEIEGEGGGEASTRSETLLPLFRTIVLVALSVMVVMSILYSLGVQIGPLLAGAGVVGIAVGFGSQKLVQDIISGMFFLIDDAFRKGEYVELAGLRGTVEKLSVRSMRLRHHLGAVQTIPYGEINTVKNLSRDWVTMKLELRLPYDVDIEKVRKIIKKIGLEMLEDPEMGPNMLAPLKSQGVMRVEESALIIRMKFTAKPGEQWVVRRQAYSRVRDALAAEGIEFAHREVKVRMPQELEQLQKLEYHRKLNLPKTDSENPSDDDPGIRSAGPAAAAVSAVIAHELAKHDKIDADEQGDDQ